MGFRKFKSLSPLQAMPCNPLSEYRESITETVEGRTVTRVVDTVKPNKEIVDSLPRIDIYNLKNLIASGVEIKQLPVAGLLDPQDSHDIEILRENNVVAAVERLQQIVRERKTTTVKPNETVE